MWIQWRIKDLPDEGGLVQISKLHENERNWTQGVGGRTWHTPPQIRQWNICKTAKSLLYYFLKTWLGCYWMTPSHRSMLHYHAVFDSHVSPHVLEACSIFRSNFATIEVFVLNINLSFLYNIDIERFHKVAAKIKLPLGHNTNHH